MSATVAGGGIERILLVSLDNIGDTVFASALVPPLRAHFPTARLAVWTKAYAAEIGALIPTASDVFASDPFWDRTPGRGKGGLAPFARAVGAVRSDHFDLAIAASAPWRTAAALAATRIPIRVGHRRRHNSWFLTHTVAPADRQRPVLRELARLLEPLGIVAGDLRYALDRTSLAGRITRLRGRITARFVALHPFASTRNRCVPLPVWLDVAREMEREGDLDSLWIGSPAELQELRDFGATPRSRFIDQVGDGTLSDTAAALSMATVFAGHDSGPLHIAGAFGVPVLGVFAPGEPRRTFPQGIGPARMLARQSPDDIGRADILGELEPLLGAAPVARRA